MTNKLKQLAGQALKFQKEATFGTTVILTVGIVAVLNFLAAQIFFRLDLTENKDYSISQTSRQVLAGLDDVIYVKTYFSANTPAQFIQVKQDVRDILEAYENYSGGKLRIENIDPASDAELKMELRSQGIPEIQFNDYGKDKIQVVNGYMGLAIHYGDKVEVIPVIQDTNSLEYQLTIKIKKIAEDEPLSIGYVTSNKTASMDEAVKNSLDALRSLYDVENIDLEGKKDIPKALKALLLVGPTDKISDEALKKIDSYLMSGGSVAIFADGVSVDRSMQPKVNDIGLNKLLEKYGLKLNSDLIIDPVSGVAAFNQGFMTFNVEYPFWPRLTAKSFVKDNPAFARLNNVVLQWPSSIVINEEEQKESQRVVLAQTSNKSSLVRGNFDLSPQQDFNSSEFDQYPVAVMVSGKIKSAFDKKETEQGRLVLVSDSDFMNDLFIQGQPDNANFFSNIVDMLALDQNFAYIRAKGVTSRPIRADLTDKEKSSIRYSNVLGLTMLTAVYGLYRYTARRRKGSLS
jgi:gliding-associated putative ABC transporter substrate-binding component GldG